ncbi:tRNA (N(6)-L-threonylcarbamoyladenosine(37)-C(2))-methylthiotransferase MtaB [Lachnospiraceae bacterium MD308]|nr:tRNA (N(6)-L-threonylcarbamoyladenosine(37)-C(2))-methylthiotransferase MtaB [Lachnospiraceae bacterium MD308]
MKKVALHNLGCKVNAYEMEAMQQILVENGYVIVPFSEKADIYIVNTCTVTNMADRKSRQMLHRAKLKNPEAVIVAAGCYVQEKGGQADEVIDIVVGNNRKKDIAEILAQYERERQKEVLDARLDIGHVREYEDLCLSQTAGHTRAYIKIQDGCNQFCSYCIIPFARGRVRSRKLQSVINEVHKLAENGYKEVVLTGIHLSSYGVDLEGEEDSLLSLILHIHETAGIERIRLGSLEPGIITEEFAKKLGSLPKMCPHFHLSLQSGCDETLKRMNRRYTSEEYYEKCCLLRKYFKNPALTTDIIVGFPGETEEEFEQSRAFVDKVNFYETHVFQYSRREGTKAAAMEHQVPEKIKNERSRELIELSRKKQEAFENAFIGTVKEVLIEEVEICEDGLYGIGHTKEYVKIRQKLNQKQVNQMVNVEIESHLQIMH